ncbi:MAG: nucleoside permease [Pirellulales bacterium]
MDLVLSARLSIMMFIQFFVWGAWYVMAPSYLGTIGFSGDDIGWTYSVGPIAGIISPFFVGMIADRFFSTERVLGVMHLAGAAAMFWATVMMQSADPSPAAINTALFIYMLCYFPTLALTNSLALHTMTNAEKEFPLIRVFGTIGWIVAGATLAWFGWEASIAMFYLATAAAVLLGVYSFTLPHAPPPAAGKGVSVRQLLGVDALVLLKRPSFLVFMASSFLICIPLAFYYQLAARTVEQAGVANPAFKMSFGQMSEIVFMLAMPLFFRRLGVKWMLFVGMLAWVIRYVLFAIGAPDGITWMLILGILLHGICYDFFFVTGQIYTDKIAPDKIRTQAQGMLVLFTLGLGMLIGAQIGGQAEKTFTPPESEELSQQVQVVGEKVAQLQGELDVATGPEKKRLEQQVKEFETEKAEHRLASLKAIDWRKIWSIPAAGAAVILVIFTAVFKDDSEREREVSEREVAEAAAREENP